MSFEKECQWLVKARFRGMDNTASEKDIVIEEINQRKDGWKHIDEEGGEFSSEELAKLIDTYFSIISYLKQKK